MALYRVLEKSYINNTIAEEGAIVEYDGEASYNLESIVEPKAVKDKKDAAPSADSLV